jgi:CheY-like chemotaxis protein
MSESPADNKTSGQERKRILIVEDNTETQLILKIYLRDFYDVDLVQTGTEGIKKIKKNEYALIILDINLPGDIDGDDVIRKIRTDPELKSVPILVVTAYALKGDKEKYLSMGASGYLAKPVDKKVILKAVQELIP